MLSHFSHVQLFVTPWTVAHQAPLSMGFSRQETGVGCHCLFQETEGQETEVKLLAWGLHTSSGRAGLEAWPLTPDLVIF